jgi:predicted transcriptional regulator
MKAKTDRTLIAVRIDTKTADGLEKLAVKMDRSISWLVRAACDAYVARGGK